MIVNFIKISFVLLVIKYLFSITNRSNDSARASKLSKWFRMNHEPNHTDSQTFCSMHWNKSKEWFIRESVVLIQTVDGGGHDTAANPKYPSSDNDLYVHLTWPYISVLLGLGQVKMASLNRQMKPNAWTDCSWLSVVGQRLFCFQTPKPPQEGAVHSDCRWEAQLLKNN